MRADKGISFLVSDCSRSFAADLISDGSIKINKGKKKPGYRLRAGDEISGQIPPPEPVRFTAEPIPLDILFEDEYLIAVNKPAGMVVHPAPGHYSGTLVNALLHHCPDIEGSSTGKLRPGIVHRLDKDTSGTLVIAKTPASLENLAMQFKMRDVKKKYLAIVCGSPKNNSGHITLPIGRHPVLRKKMSVTSKHLRSAETFWTVHKRFEGASLLTINIKTGRTHQIRVHCRAISHPVIGDPIYGSPKRIKALPEPAATFARTLKRQMLHAKSLEFTHPVSKKKIRVQSPMPEDMENMILKLQD